MLGGFQEVPVNEDHREILTGNEVAIAHKLKLGTPELKINKVFEQVVNGKYIWYHLTDMKNGE